VPDHGLPAQVLHQLAALVPCDVLSFNDFDHAVRRVYVDQEWTGDPSVPMTTTAEDDDVDPFFDCYWQTLSCSYPSRTGDLRSVTKRSDFYSEREWRQSPMYVDYFRGQGRPFAHSLSCCLPSPGSRLRRFLFFRITGDFDERDRLTLALLRPHLAEMHREFERARAAVPKLTARQTQLLKLVAEGRTNAQIASQLFVSTHTVRKHLENIFERLQVSTRAAAVTRAFPDGAAAD
jgi:DNA-binding CsgD family transcriptional regulator